MSLDDASRVLAIACMLVASKNMGSVPADEHYFRRVAYLNKKPNFKPLLDCGFLEISQANASTFQADARPEAEAEAETYSKEAERVGIPIPEHNLQEERVLKNDLEAAAAACCSLLQRHRLSNLDIEILRGWCGRYDFNAQLKPVLIEKAAACATRNHGKPPATLSYFSEAIKEKLR